MKTILIAVDTFYPKKDGVVRFLENIVPLLAEKFKIKILAPKYDGDGFNIKNVEVIKLPISKRIKFAGYNPVKCNKKTRKIIKKNVKEADIIFSQDIALIGRKSISYGKKYKKPVVAYIHQIIWEQFSNIATRHKIIKKLLISITKWVTKRIYKKCSLLFVPSISVDKQLLEEGVRKEKEIVPLGINVQRFRPPQNKESAKVNVGIDPNRFVIGYCGRLSKEKDIKTLIDAFIDINKRHKEALLLIIGGGEEEEISSLKKIPNIKVTGFVEDVLPYIQALDLFVMPSLTETTSLATMEAMACGVPVIATPVGRIKEYVKKNYNGFIFPKGNVNTLVNRIEEIMGDKKKAEILGMNARKTMLLFSWESTARKMIEIFNKL
ncbi:MAG: glycosyltransferase family 4 protein [Candidatus Woesearchaeota archaeon]